jgi:hypothetical protein
LPSGQLGDDASARLVVNLHRSPLDPGAATDKRAHRPQRNHGGGQRAGPQAGQLATRLGSRKLAGGQVKKVLGQVIRHHDRSLLIVRQLQPAKALRPRLRRQPIDIGGMVRWQGHFGDAGKATTIGTGDLLDGHQIAQLSPNQRRQPVGCHRNQVAGLVRRPNRCRQRLHVMREDARRPQRRHTLPHRSHREQQEQKPRLQT